MPRVARSRHPWAPLLWPAGLVAVAHLPFLSDALPFLRLARGPLGVALVLAGVAAFAAATGPGRRTAARARALARRARPATLFTAAFLVYAGVGLFYTERLGVSGDEPHYLLMAQSLWRDHDLDLQDEIARGDWQEFTPNAFAPHYGAPRRDGRPFPAHSPGLAALLAPAYAAGGRRGCVLLMAALAAALTVVVYALALRLTLRREAALLAWAAVAGPPVAYYAFHLYTEVPSALALASSLLLLLGTPSVAAAAGAALLASFLPWLHLKMSAAAAVLGLLALARLRGRSLAAFGAVAGLMAVGFLAYYQSVFGRPSPLALYGGMPADFEPHPVRAAAGLLFDRSYGLLPHAPVFVIGLAGIGALLAASRTRPEARWLLAVAVAVAGPVLGWRMWWAGQCPPARFLVPVLPILAAAIAMTATRPHRGLSRWRLGLLVVGFALAAIAVHDPEQRLLLSRANRPTRLWATLSADPPLERYLPALPRGEPVEDRVAVLWALALAGLLAADRWARRNTDVDRGFEQLAVLVLLLVGLGAGVDLWARSGPQETQGAPTVLRTSYP